MTITIVLTVAVVVGFTLTYRSKPFKALEAVKPKFTLFPKYVVNLDRPIAEIELSLMKLGFKKGKNGAFSRGKIYGDFSAKSIKLSVDINEEEKRMTIHASFLGILFDTGDIWQVTTDIITG